MVVRPFTILPRYRARAAAAALALLFLGSECDGAEISRRDWNAIPFSKLPGGETRHHTAVVWGVTRSRHVQVLHQNWAGGQERGRKVGPGLYSPNELESAGIYRPIPRKTDR